MVRPTTHTLTHIDRFSEAEASRPIFPIIAGGEDEFKAAFGVLLQHAQLVDRNIHKMTLLIEDHLIRPLIEIVSEASLKAAVSH